MNLTGVTCVKNEADIIEAFVRHNLFYLDRLIVLDHGSTDETPSILRALRREGLPLEIIRDDSLGKLQGEKMTYLMRLAAETGADWIFFLDGDEFIKSSAESRLALPEDGPGVLKVAVQTYCAQTCDDRSEINPVIRIPSRLASEPFQDKSLEERRFYLHCIVRRDVALASECQVLQGSHQVIRKGKEVEYTLCTDFSLAHYSLRSPGQYAAKIAIGMLQHLSHTTLSVPPDSFYIPHLDLLRRDFDAFTKEFYQHVPAYIEVRKHSRDKVRDPLFYRGAPLQYTPLLSDSAILTSNLLGYSESLARNLSQLPVPSEKMEKTAVQLTLKKQMFPQRILGSTPCLVGPLHPEMVTLPLKKWNGREKLVLEISGPTSYVEFISLSLRMKDGTVLKLTGKPLHGICKVLSKAQDIYRGQHFTFIKGVSPAELLFDFKKAGLPGQAEDFELGLRFDTNPAIIGLRFFQEDPFEREEYLLSVYRTLQKSFKKMSRLRGFLGHHVRSRKHKSGKLH